MPRRLPNHLPAASWVRVTPSFRRLPAGTWTRTSTCCSTSAKPAQTLPRHGQPDPQPGGADAGRITEEVIAHCRAAGGKVTVTLEIEADVPAGVPDNVVRTVTENARTLKFTSPGFEKE